MPRRFRPRLERALFEAGFETAAEFAGAIGYHPATVRCWLRCGDDPGEPARRAIAEALDLCWGSEGVDDDVWRSDVDWLLEPCDATD